MDMAWIRSSLDGPLLDLIEAALAVASDYHYADENEGFEDLSWCPYTRRGLPGADPHGICSFGCREEPACHTSGPWPLQNLDLAFESLGAWSEDQQQDHDDQKDDTDSADSHD